MSDELLIHKAIEFAAIKHSEQKRKSTNTPYISHIMEVYGFLLSNNCDTDTIIGGILHDVLEDTPTKAEEIKELFGDKIAQLVASESEDKSRTWKERKQTTIDHLANASLPVKQICCADKLSNLMSIYYDYTQIGDKVWERFNADKDSIRWYYDEIINALKLGDFQPYIKLKKYFNLVFNIKNFIGVDYSDRDKLGDCD